MAQPLFDNLAEVGERIRRAPRALLCLDFDGTLTEFAGDPAEVCLAPRRERTLRALVQHDKLAVAIISGRSRADLCERVGIAGLIYAGNHGLEISGPGYVFVEPTAAAKSEELRELAKVLAARLRSVPGIIVEYKGLTISIHYRRCGECAGEIQRVVHGTLAGTSHPFVLGAGDKVYEIRPRVYWNKGTAVTWIRKQLGPPERLTIYVGDDVTDEDAFTAIREGITVKVGSGAETAAHYMVEGPPEVGRFLEWLERELRAPGPLLKGPFSARAAAQRLS
jgi:trehalose 6-phosphate phosphatase